MNTAKSRKALNDQMADLKSEQEAYGGAIEPYNSTMQSLSGQIDAKNAAIAAPRRISRMSHWPVWTRTIEDSRAL